MGDVIKLCEDDTTADDLLEEYKGKFKSVIIVGLDDDDMTLASNIDDPYMEIVMLLDAADLSRNSI
jgi:hypothetical protein